VDEKPGINRQERGVGRRMRLPHIHTQGFTWSGAGAFACEPIFLWIPTGADRFENLRYWPRYFTITDTRRLRLSAGLAGMIAR